MRLVVVVSLVLGAVVVACTVAPAQPTIIVKPGSVDHYPTVEGPDAANDQQGESKDAATAVDAADASVPDAEPMTCTGPDVVGGPSDNCEARGPCSLSTCMSGEAFSCSGSSGPSSGFPQTQQNCVNSPADETKLGQGSGHVSCCDRVCVRHSQGDGDCHATAFSCPSGVVPTPPIGMTTCNKSATTPGDYCCR